MGEQTERMSHSWRLSGFHTSCMNCGTVMTTGNVNEWCPAIEHSSPSDSGMAWESGEQTGDRAEAIKAVASEIAVEVLMDRIARLRAVAEASWKLSNHGRDSGFTRTQGDWSRIHSALSALQRGDLED